MGTTIQSQIVLSFAMKEGGHAFSIWLRDQLMKRLGLFDPLAVYLDTVASRELRMPRRLLFGSRPQPPVEIDRRPEMQLPGRTDGPHPLGVQRPDWNDNFRQALASARAIVFVLNRNFHLSKWCCRELGQAQEENRRRARQGRPPLKLVVLDFMQTACAKKSFPGAAFIAATEVSGAGEPLLWAPRQWKIDDEAMRSLVRAVR